MRTLLKGPQVPTHPAAVRERYDRMLQAVGARSRFVTRPSGGRVHVIESGDGPPVVQLHGNNTSSLSHLMLLKELPGVRSYLVDRPGFGLSEPDDFPRARFRQDAVRFLDEVLDALEVDTAVLLGASGGGVVATWYTLDRPERVRGLVMLGSVPMLPGARIPLGLRLMATPGVGNMLRRAMRPDRRMMLRLLTTMGEGDTIMRHPDLLDSLVDAARDPVAVSANAAELRAFLSPLAVRPATRIRPEELRRIAKPTLMIWGDHDPVVSVEAARSVAMLIPDARPERTSGGPRPAARATPRRRRASGEVRPRPQLIGWRPPRSVTRVTARRLSTIACRPSAPIGDKMKSPTSNLCPDHAGHVVPRPRPALLQACTGSSTRRADHSRFDWLQLHSGECALTDPSTATTAPRQVSRVCQPAGQVPRSRNHLTNLHRLADCDRKASVQRSGIWSNRSGPASSSSIVSRNRRLRRRRPDCLFTGLG